VFFFAVWVMGGFEWFLKSAFSDKSGAPSPPSVRTPPAHPPPKKKNGPQNQKHPPPKPHPRGSPRSHRRGLSLSFLLLVKSRLFLQWGGFNRLLSISHVLPQIPVISPSSRKSGSLERAPADRKKPAQPPAPRLPLLTNPIQRE